MSVLIGGGVSVMLGLVLLIYWYKHFLVLLMGALPILLIMGGALAVYVGLDELKDKIRETQEKEKEEEDEIVLTASTDVLQKLVIPFAPNDPEAFPEPRLLYKLE